MELALEPCGAFSFHAIGAFPSLNVDGALTSSDQVLKNGKLSVIHFYNSG